MWGTRDLQRTNINCQAKKLGCSYKHLEYQLQCQRFFYLELQSPGIFHRRSKKQTGMIKN